MSARTMICIQNGEHICFVEHNERHDAEQMRKFIPELKYSRITSTLQCYPEQVPDRNIYPLNSPEPLQRPPMVARWLAGWIFPEDEIIKPEHRDYSRTQPTERAEPFDEFDLARNYLVESFVFQIDDAEDEGDTKTKDRCNKAIARINAAESNADFSIKVGGLIHYIIEDGEMEKEE